MRESPARFAQVHALQLQTQFPKLFEKIPVQVEVIADKINVPIIRHSVSNHSWFERTKDEPSIYFYDGYENKSFSRFVLAHELGHAYISANHRNFISRADYQWLEHYSSVFANEILIPESQSEIIINSIKSLRSVRDIVGISNRYNVPVPSVFYLFKKYRKYFDGQDFICFRSKEVVNQKTKRDKKFRVLSPCFDSYKYFVAQNQGLERILGDYSWLYHLNAGELIEREGTVRLHARTGKAKPKFEIIKVGCKIDVIRLHRAKANQETQFIFFVTLSNITKD